MYKVVVGSCFILLVLGTIVSAAPAEDDLAFRIRQFDAPRTAPMARIIRLTNGLNQGQKPTLLKDKAGSFDNFEAFEGIDAEELEPRDGKAGRKYKNEEKNVGNFFPEDEIPE